MSKIKEFFQNDQIQMSLGLGVLIILMALASKKILPEPLSYLETATPGIVFLFYEIAKGSKIDDKYKRPLLWNSLMTLCSLLVIVLNYY